MEFIPFFIQNLSQITKSTGFDINTKKLKLRITKP